HAERANLVGATELGQVDDEARGKHLRALLLEKLYRAFGGTTGRDQVVDQNDLLALHHRVFVHLHFVEPVLQPTGAADALVRQLGLLADWDESGRDLMRHRAAQDKTSRFDAGHLVDLRPGPRLHQFVDRAAKRAGVAEQRGDVAKHDAGLGIVRYAP